MSAAERPTTYAELAEVIENLPLLVRERRRQMRLSARAAAREIGMSAATVSRVENGQGLDSPNLAAILRWLDSAGGSEENQDSSQLPPEVGDHDPVTLRPGESPRAETTIHLPGDTDA